MAVSPWLVCQDEVGAFVKWLIRAKEMLFGSQGKMVLVTCLSGKLMACPSHIERVFIAI